MSYTDTVGTAPLGGHLGVDGGAASMDSTPFTVMCIDDNVLLVDALERRLNLETGFGGLQRVQDLARAADEAARSNPSVILLDVDLPGGIDAMGILDQIAERVPDSRVVVFTGYPTGDLVRRTMSRGAWGFVSKGVTSDRLIAAIRRVVAGQAVIELEE
jgi:DNA-binding NarL/FixJ family response regulator